MKMTATAKKQTPLRNPAIDALILSASRSRNGATPAQVKQYHRRGLKAPYRADDSTAELELCLTAYGGVCITSSESVWWDAALLMQLG
ncbi:hypothetical protein N7465_005325 [Penicillium sp. CMV-2018d]|nr:hypothetical protein N7465_005325 [Penicillium sp. CMV-2018d]